MCSSSLSSSSCSPFIIWIAFSSLPPLYEAIKKKAQSVGVNASRCCSADTQEKGRKESEEEDRGRQEERRWNGVWEREERESRRERECFVSAAAWLTETVEDRAECALCVSVYIFVCVAGCALCACCDKCAQASECICMAVCEEKKPCREKKSFVLIVRWRLHWPKY